MPLFFEYNLSMNKIDTAINEIHEIDELSAMDSPVHRFSALAKLLMTIVYIILSCRLINMH